MCTLHSRTKRVLIYYMVKDLLTPDYIFESSWEVCNKVGGIYTVLVKFFIFFRLKRRLIKPLKNQQRQNLLILFIQFFSFHLHSY